MSGHMLNDLSSPLALLETRRSGRPREMVAPGPSQEELQRMLAVATRVPDHGKLSPWRFVIVGRDQREAFAALLHRALSQEDSSAGEAHHAKAETFASQGEALVVLISSPVRERKIAVWEQELSCGAAAMNLLSAAHAMGFVAGWLTGRHAYSPTVTAAFCGPGERIAGFMFIGSPGRELEERPRPDLTKVVKRWQPPSN
jgi:nitroreductase